MTDYEETRRTFRLQVPHDYEFTRDVVEHWAAEQSGKLALVALDPHGVGRREARASSPKLISRRVANALEGLGITAGERAFVMLPRIPEWYELLLGMFRFGVVPMPATTRPKTVYFASRCGCGECVMKNWLPPVSAQSSAIPRVPRRYGSSFSSSRMV